MENALAIMDGWDIQTLDKEPRVEATAVGERLGMSEPRAIKKLIERNRTEFLEYAGISTRDTVKRVAREARGVVDMTVTEYWLTEEQALLLAILSRAPKAPEVRRSLIKAYIAVRKSAEAGRAAEHNIYEKLKALLFAPKPTEWERCFKPSLVAKLCRLDGYTYDGGRHPRHLASTNRKIYDAIFSTAVGNELKARNPEPRQGRNHSQQLSAEARDYLVAKLDVVESIAHQSQNKADFWSRMDREFGGGMLQLGFESVRKIKA